MSRFGCVHLTHRFIVSRLCYKDKGRARRYLLTERERESSEAISTTRFRSLAGE